MSSETGSETTKNSQTATKTLMRFGKYRDKPIDLVPLDYLLWSITMLGVRRAHHDYVGIVLLELRNRLVKNISAAHQELLLPQLEAKKLDRSTFCVVRKQGEDSKGV